MYIHKKQECDKLNFYLGEKFIFMTFVLKPVRINTNIVNRKFVSKFGHV